MKYFAKYLPVEEKAKAGDWCFDKGADNMLFKMGTAINNPNYPTDLLKHIINNAQKVKLFLCSRNIQVGDKVQEWYSNKLYREYIVDEIYQDMDSENNLHTMIKGGNEAVDSNNCFKVIGEISPDATWVKEGDELDDSKVEEWWGQAETHYPMIKKLTWDGDTTYLAKRCPTVYKIKGPCGHFH